jgi:hypothetical protein
VERSCRSSRARRPSPAQRGYERLLVRTYCAINLRKRVNLCYSAAQRLQQISHWNYIPTAEDFIQTHMVNDKSNCESQIIYLNKIFRFIDPHGDAVQSVISGDRHGLLAQLGIVIYVVALSDYAIRVPGYPSKLHRALDSLSALAAVLPKHTKKLFLYFNKVTLYSIILHTNMNLQRDEFERLLPLVPLNMCFPETSRMSYLLSWCLIRV